MTERDFRESARTPPEDERDSRSYADHEDERRYVSSERDRESERFGRSYGEAGRAGTRDYRSGRDLEYGPRMGRDDWSTGPFVGRGPRGYRRSDERIQEDVCERLTQHPMIDASDIEVTVRNSEVTLRGNVDGRRTKRLAEDTADSVSGVTDVHNELRVQSGRESETTRASGQSGAVGSDPRETAYGTRPGAEREPTGGTREAAASRTVIGVFDDTRRAEQALSEMKESGFSANQISLVARDRGDAKAVAEGSGVSAETKAAGTGAVLGGITGGVLGWLVGVGALAIPGIGPIVAAGALATTLGGAAAGAVAGGLLGALVGLGIPEEEAKRYEARVREGGILVTVNAHDDQQVQRSRSILERHGASDVRAYEGKDAQRAQRDLERGREREEQEERDEHLAGTRMRQER